MSVDRLFSLFYTCKALCEHAGCTPVVRRLTCTGKKLVERAVQVGRVPILDLAILLKHIERWIEERSALFGNYKSQSN